MLNRIGFVSTSVISVLLICLFLILVGTIINLNNEIHELRQELEPTPLTHMEFIDLVFEHFEHGQIGGIGGSGDQIEIYLSPKENGLSIEEIEESLKEGGFYEMATEMGRVLSVQTLANAVESRMRRLDDINNEINIITEREGLI